jgi:hypothetical protein
VNVIDGMAIEEQKAFIAMLRAIQVERQAARGLPSPEALQ